MVRRLLDFWTRIETGLARRWTERAHRRLMRVQWTRDPLPEHFDHHIDLFYQWLATRNPLWVERGVFGGLALQGGDVLELACGDGFNARNFYSLRSRQVIACDFDPAAIATARTKNAAPNVTYVLADIRTDAIPSGLFENVVWDAAIEHFTTEEIDDILRRIRTRLAEGGTFSGYTLVARPDGDRPLPHHEHEFSGREELLSRLSPHFKNVTVFQTDYPNRSNLYWWASNGPTPFSAGWPAAVHSINHGPDCAL